MATSLNSHTITISSSIPYKCFCVDGKFCDSSIKKKKETFAFLLSLPFIWNKLDVYLLENTNFALEAKQKIYRKNHFILNFSIRFNTELSRGRGNGYEYFKRFWENGLWFCVFFYDCRLWFRGVKTCLQYLQQT